MISALSVHQHSHPLATSILLTFLQHLENDYLRLLPWHFLPHFPQQYLLFLFLFPECLHKPGKAGWSLRSLHSSHLCTLQPHSPGDTLSSASGRWLLDFQSSCFLLSVLRSSLPSRSVRKLSVPLCLLNWSTVVHSLKVQNTSGCQRDPSKLPPVLRKKTTPLPDPTPGESSGSHPSVANRS